MVYGLPNFSRRSIPCNFCVVFSTKWGEDSFKNEISTTLSFVNQSFTPISTWHFCPQTSSVSALAAHWESQHHTLFTVISKVCFTKYNIPSSLVYHYHWRKLSQMMLTQVDTRDNSLKIFGQHDSKFQSVWTTCLTEPNWIWQLWFHSISHGNLVWQVLVLYGALVEM